MIFNNREHVGHLPARRLIRYKGKNPLVLGIPRSALPMAKIIADALDGELDVVLVRKLGYPGQPELAIGAVDESGAIFLADYAAEVSAAYIEAEKEEQLELIRRRRALYTPVRPPIDPRDRITIVVDDGIATGATMIAALRATRAKKPRECDTLVCLNVPAEFYAVGQFFRDFQAVSDEDVVAILREREEFAAVPA
jgi:predicted phosphoribosyltransferase